MESNKATQQKMMKSLKMTISKIEKMQTNMNGSTSHKWMLQINSTEMTSKCWAGVIMILTTTGTPLISPN